MSTPVVLITGALAGIGRATALAFAKEGARIVVSGHPEEIARTIVFLASDKVPYITGQTIDVNGGKTAA
jgi:NAD(P)-dependent dehydrogenase (short-subunit alcohol dehydrogenase family)